MVAILDLKMVNIMSIIIIIIGTYNKLVILLKNVIGNRPFGIILELLIHRVILFLVYL